MLHAKALLLAALACRMTLAADCNSGGSCTVEADETSLLQVKQEVEHGSERYPIDDDAPPWLGGFDNGFTDGLRGMPTPVADWRGMAEAMPGRHLDAGDVQSAFKKHAFAAKMGIERSAASNIDFASQVYQSRKINHDLAEEAVRRARMSTKEAIAEDKRELAQTKKERQRVVHAAIAKVKRAKEAKIAHDIKAKQAEKAAELGRAVGKIEGKDAAHHAWEHYKASIKAEAATVKKAKEARDAAEKEAAKRKRINEDTVELAARDSAWAARVHEQAEAIRAHSAAAAGSSMEAIEGAEGLKNRITEIKAKMAADHYNWDTEQDQDRIKAAAAGKWP